MRILLRKFLAASVGASVLSGMLPSLAFGGEVPREFRSSRYLGMGDAGVSLAEGYLGIFYNPAGMSDIKGILNEIVIASPEISVSSHARTLASDLQGDVDVLDIVEKVSNKPQHAAVQNFTGVVFRRAAIGVMQKVQVDAFVGTDPDTGVLMAEALAVGRVGVHGSLARGFVDDSLFVGVGVKVMHKAEAHVRVDVVSAQEQFSDMSMKSFMENNVRRGTGLGLDLGVLWKIKSDSQPRLGATLRNVGGLKYRWPVPSGGNAPSSDLQQLDLGASVSPGTKRSRVVLAVDLHDALNSSKEIIYKRLHMGAMISFEGVVGLMGGLNQGYPTYGAFLNLRVIRAEVGMYSEELEKYPGDRRSQRIFGRIHVGWSQ